MPLRNFYSVFSNDLPQARDWYVGLLGYRVTFESDWFIHLQSPDNPLIEVGILARDHEIVPEAMRGRPCGGMLTVIVDDVDVIYARALANQVRIVEPPRDLFYGQRRMLVLDPNGQLVDVSSECAPDSQWLASLAGQSENLTATPIEIRRAKDADLAILVQLLADDPLGQAREDPRRPIADVYQRAFGALDNDPNQYLAVAERDGVIVGMLQLTFLPGLSRMGAWRGQIESVRVSQSARRAGIGQIMFEWAIGQCRQRDCRLLQLTSDRSRQSAHSFYVSLGFEATHFGYKLNL